MVKAVVDPFENPSFLLDIQDLRHQFYLLNLKNFDLSICFFFLHSLLQLYTNINMVFDSLPTVTDCHVHKVQNFLEKMFYLFILIQE